MCLMVTAPLVPKYIDIGSNQGPKCNYEFTGKTEDRGTCCLTPQESNQTNTEHKTLIRTNDLVLPQINGEGRLLRDKRDQDTQSDAICGF